MKKIFYIFSLIFCLLVVSCKSTEVRESQDIEVAKTVYIDRTCLVITNRSELVYTVEIFENDKKAKKVKIVANGGIQYLVEDANAEIKVYFYAVKARIKYQGETIISLQY